MTPIDSIVARLTALHPKRIDLSLDRMQRLLAALGHPERRLPPVIHVAGTNGKGSTIAFLRAILEAAGQRVHVYTSPHLVHFNERFRLDGKLVSDAELATTLDECERVSAGFGRGAKSRSARRAGAPGGAAQSADENRGRGLDRDRGTRPPGLSGRQRAARSAGAQTLRPPSVRERRARHRRAA